MRRSVLTAAAFALLAAGCSSGGSGPAAASGDYPTVPPSPTAAAPSASPSPSVIAAPADSSTCKVPSDDGDVYIRYVVPGIDAQAQRVGGFDEVRCVSTVDELATTSATGAGYCTQVGLVSANPGYDPDATPAKPIPHVAAEYGPGC